MTSVDCENNQKFFEEIMRDLPKNPKILISLFSIEESRWAEEYEYQKDNFIKKLGDLGFEFQLADKENFLEQIDWADEIHFRGGDTLMLLETVKRFPDFKNRLTNKTVSGSSAGALFMIDKYYDKEYSKNFKGLGNLNINLITHYNSETYGIEPQEILDELKKEKELVLLSETEYKVVNLDL